MPESKYTPFCNQSFDLLRQVKGFAEESVHPAVLALREDRSRTDRNRDAAVAGAYIRVLAWLKSLEKLNQPIDFQAIGTGARCLFELFIDLKWFEKFTDPGWVAKYAAFSNVDRYLAAEKVVEHTTKYPASSIDPQPCQQFMDSVDAIEPLESVVKRIWGYKANGTPDWPLFHWTGIPNLSQRAEKLGLDALDMYRDLYSVFSWLVHAGPTAYFGRDFAEIEKHVAWAYYFAFQYGRASTIVVCRTLQIEGRIPHFADTMIQFAQWQSDALATLP